MRQEIKRGCVKYLVYWEYNPCGGRANTYDNGTSEWGYRVGDISGLSINEIHQRFDLLKRVHPKCECRFKMLEVV